MDFPRISSVSIQGTAQPSREHGAVRKTRYPQSEESREVRSDSVSSEKQPIITNEETVFFEQLFPAASHDIRSHRLYDRTGIKNAVLVGSIIDRRG